MKGKPQSDGSEWAHHRRHSAVLRFHVAVFLWTCLISWPTSAANPGDLDLSFEPALGADTDINAMILLDDGKVLTAGSFGIPGAPGMRAVVRLNGDGSLDESFAPVQADRPVLCMALHSGGRILVAGGFTQLNGATRQFIARLNRDGSVDTNFFAPDIVSPVTSIDLQAEKILVTRERGDLLRLKPDGAIDPTFVRDGRQPDLVRVLPDGKFLKITRSPGVAFYRSPADGGWDVDVGFNPTGPEGRVDAVVVQSDGRILVGGDFAAVNGIKMARVARLTADGLLDRSFDPGPGPDSPVLGIALQNNGKVVVGGAFSKFCGLPRAGVARLTPDGTVDEFESGSGTNVLVRAISIQTDGNVLIAGRFERIQGVPRHGVARLHGGEIVRLPSIFTQPANQTVLEDAEVTLEVRAAVTEAAYQWQFNGQDLPAATNTILNLPKVSLSQAGGYQAVVRNTAGAVVSRSAVLSVLPFAPLKSWTLRHEFAPSQPLGSAGLWSLAHGNGLFVVVGNNGAILTSANGQNWTQQPSSTIAQLNDVAYGNGRFIAAGNGGVARSSIDGTNWTSTVVAANIFSLANIRFVNSRFMAFSRGSIHVSENGTTWKTIPSSIDLRSVAYGNGKYVAVGESGTVLISPDAGAWDPQTTGFNASFREVIFVNGKFFAVGGVPGGGLLLTSSNGTNWARASVGNVDFLSGITFDSGMFVVVGGGGNLGYYSPTSTVLLSSTDGVTWTKMANPTEYPLNKVAYGNGTFVALGNRFVGPTVVSEIILSRGGRHWIGTGTSIALKAITSGKDTFVAVGENGTILVSADGANWSQPQSPVTAHLADVSYGSGRFVAVGRAGTILSSTNGVDWQEKISGTREDLWGVKHLRGLFMAVGGHRDVLADGATGASEYVILASPDGAQWNLVQRQLNQGSLYDVAFGGGLYLGIGAMESVGSPPGAIPPSVVVNMINSTDGVSWSRFLPSISPRIYRRVEYGNGRFVATDAGDVFAALTDASDPRKWVQWSPGLNLISGLGFGRNMFLGLGKGTIFASAEGVTWRIQQTGHPAALYDVAFGQRTFVAVGENGAILQSRVFPDEAAIALKDPAWSNGVFRTSIQTENGREYVLEFKKALEEPVWMQVHSVFGNGSIMELSDTNALVRQRFYRVSTR